MPHFGLIPDGTPPVEADLLRARLHIRGGLKRLQEGRASDAVAALYDAFLAAMRWFVQQPVVKETLGTRNVDDFQSKPEEGIYDSLANLGLIHRVLDIAAFDQLLERSFTTELDPESSDVKGVMDTFESLMVQMGIMPFSEADLPPRDPSTL